MRQIPKTELSPDNGCVIDTKWNVPPLKYYACAAAEGDAPTLTEAPPIPEVIVYDHVGFKGAYARTNLSFYFLGNFWNDRISSLIIVSGVWRFYRMSTTKAIAGSWGRDFTSASLRIKGRTMSSVRSRPWR